MSSAYANIFICFLPIFVPLGTIFILYITFCNAKLNNVGDKGSPCFSPVLFLEKILQVSFPPPKFVLLVHKFYSVVYFLRILLTPDVFH